ncbi:type VI secretion system tip protein VgrG [Variovorax paradoxus]|uniref:Type VI secretion system tip protein VgrG n=1 Tax=Variovorax paradoxus TaxID=34073 RepID=A0A5Q0M636_VARPD|nr:type VI secretion system Vgr family protein [Variovorax paradoxus]QFZ84906.1 type VI secretion system tip protein VgrG [Variovorax paradoxus]
MAEGIQSGEALLDRQHDRLLRLSFPQGGEPAGARLVINRLEASEGVSRDFEYAAELLSSNADLALKDLQGKMLCIDLVRADGSLRHFTGIVFAFRLVKTDGNLAFYEARLGPWLRYLRLRSNNRLFHRQNLKEQTQAIFDDYDTLPQWKWQVRSEDLPITMAAQGGGAQGESDHNYLHRRWEAAGYSYWYEHTAKGHTLVLADDTTLAQAVDGSTPDIRFQREGGAQEEDAIHQWSAARTLVSGRTAVSAFDFKNPRPQHADIPSGNRQGEVPQLEVHEYGGHRHFKTSREGDALATRRVEEIEAIAKHFDARGNNRQVLPGRYFRLTDHFGRTQGTGPESEFLILEVEHSASNNYLQAAGELAQYSNSFTCSRRFVPWRPGRGFHSVEQRVMAPQTATVVGPSAEGSIHTDEYGRIRVQFHWDREGQNDERSSAWVRVMSPWAGGETGAVSTPRVGSEVIVQCLDGNPDHPIVMGVVYNAQRMPPWKLPEQKALTGLKSRELAGASGNEAGGKSNHLLLDDTEGKIQAQLKSDHDSSSLSLGHITRIEDNAGRKDARGQGFELRTDGHGAIRAQDGLLISTEARANAQAHITDMGETVQRLTQGRDLHEGLSEAAQQAKAHETGDQDEVTKSLKAQNDAIKGSGSGNKAEGEFPELNEPHVVLASPSGIEATTGGSIHLVSTEHHAITSGAHTSIAAGKSLLVSAKEAVRIAAFEKGIRLVAAAADIDITALKSCINVIAKLDIKMEANRITITAKEEVLVNGGTSYTRWNASGIESGTNGIWREHAAVHSLIGPNSKGSPKLPEPAQLPKGQLDLHNHYIKSDGTPRQAVKQGEYTVVDSEGGTHSGNLDAKGFATVSGLPIGGAKITFGPDPRDPWDEGSYFGPPHEWPPKPLDEQSTASPAGEAGAMPAANLLSGKGVLGGAKGALGQIGQMAGTAQQAVAAVQAVQKGGAQALLGQAGQLASGAATRAIGKVVGDMLGPMGAPAAGAVGSVVAGGMKGGLAGAAAAAQNSMSGAVASVVPKLPGALPSLPSLGSVNPATAMTGRTPGFAG